VRLKFELNSSNGAFSDVFKSANSTNFRLIEMIHSLEYGLALLNF